MNREERLSSFSMSAMSTWKKQNTVEARGNAESVPRRLKVTI